MKAPENVRSKKNLSIIIIIECTDVLKFDNSFSWVRSKEVFYSVKVIPPETPETIPV